MENIHIIENFLSSDELITAHQIINSSKWEYGHKSNTENPLSTPFMIIKLIDIPFFAQHLKEKIELICNKTLQLDRVYANGQVFGQNGSFHQDNEAPNTLTFCLYLAQIDDHILDEIGGEIMLKLPNNPKFNVCVQPKYNRGVIFPSNYYHKGMAFSRYVQNLRVCVAWKFTIIN
jgi:Rps23 Pro-64 3,4-dihydroxylase Tpa1-like proline 4-hydroxylase